MTIDLPRARSAHDLMIDEVIFKRDLDEVHLLLDFVSGQTDKSLDSLTIADAADPTGKTRMTTRAVVERITAIRYPPDGKQPAQNAADAAFLLVVKDQLNGMAHPARGLTVAYTAMFVGAAGKAGSLWSWMRRLFRAADPTRPDHGAGDMNLAAEIYPGMPLHATIFRWWFAFLVAIVLPAWLMLTALTYWDNALGRQIMQRFDRVEQDRRALVQANPTLVQVGACDRDVKPELMFACARLAELAGVRTATHRDLDRFRGCNEGASLKHLHVMQWGSTLCDVSGGKEPAEQMIATVLLVYSNYILPMMFGLLGTMIAAIRKIQDQVGKSELHPRDLLLTMLLMPTGAVAAVAVGLFFSPTGTAAGGSAGLSGDLTLTAGGIGFLAGYGSPAFFVMMDGLLRQVFRLEKPGPKDKPATPA